MTVEYLDKMGDDLAVVNAARVSFEQTHEMFTKGDKGLINFLAKHNHWTPFGHTSIKFRIEAPVFVARQLIKHQIGLVWNEVSRRYVKSEPTFFMPDNWRAMGDDIKQGSLQNEFVESIHWDGSGEKLSVNGIVNAHNKQSLVLYQQLIKANVCPEQARMVLPQSMNTQWIWTGNVASIARICSLRCKPDTQKETRDVANLMSDIMLEHFPVSWEALCDY